MRTSLVLTVIADDKPGIVERLADQSLETGANWEQGRMARLAGKFAGLLHVSVDREHAGTLAANLRALEAEGLTIVVADAREDPVGTVVLLTLELVGQDRPGIVRDISRVLAEHQVNIEELETDLSSAPMSGEVLFRARAHLQVPSTVSPDRLRRQLEQLAGELMVDLTLDASPRPGE